MRLYPASVPALFSVLLFSCGHPADSEDHDTEEHEPQAYAEGFVRITGASELSGAGQIALAACQGLANHALGGSVYVEWDDGQADWPEILGLTQTETLEATAFLTQCASEHETCVRYDYASQQAILPAIITAAAALGALPVDDSLGLPCAGVAWDATVELADASTPAAATQAVFDRFGTKTTGLAMLNPGYDPKPTDHAHPAIVRTMLPNLVDQVFHEQLFALFLVNGCRQESEEYGVLDGIVHAGLWDFPLPVYGYNNAWTIGGSLYEAQTRCLDSHDMGAIPTSTTNLSFFATRRPHLTDPAEIPHLPASALTYDPTKTYVALVLGDGDNIDYVLSRNETWMAQRSQICRESPDDCLPLTWTISPHLPRLAPDVLIYFAQAAQVTGHDDFALPPSGHLYAYPSSMSEAMQTQFVAQTEADARLMGVHSVVHWDWNTDWTVAHDTFLPKYAVEGQIQGIIPVNVPYLIDAFPDWPADKAYEVLGGKTVLFRPRSWRGITGSDAFMLTPEAMAAEINAYAPGSVHAIYITSDGGLTFDNAITPMLHHLEPHVVMTSADDAARLALEAYKR